MKNKKSHVAESAKQNYFLDRSPKFWMLSSAISIIIIGLMYVIFSPSAVYRVSAYLVIIESVNEIGDDDTVCYRTTGAMIDTLGETVIGTEPPELIYSERGKYSVGDTSLILEDQTVGAQRVNAH